LQSQGACCFALEIYAAYPSRRVSSAVVQRYLPQILDASLGSNTTVQNAAVDILGFTIRQGLAHPLQVCEPSLNEWLLLTPNECLPTIIALETSENAQLSGRANGLHTILHSKHASLIHARYLDCAQATFKYQERITTDVTRGQSLEVPQIFLTSHRRSI
jgi:cohesin loading factor subunit SCC2